VPPRRRGPSPEELSGSEQVGLFVGNVCLSPLLGVVLYYVWRDRHPVRAAQACALTRWAVGLWVAFFLLAMIAGVLSEL
jgi:hypothetical protein